MKRIIQTLFCLLILADGRVLAQSPDAVPVKVTGVVTDKAGKPLAGVAVSRQDQRGSEVLTDPDGRFSVDGNLTDVLHFKKPGYTSQQVPADAVSKANLVLAPASIDGGDDDVVYIPFGLPKKRAVTAAISTLRGSDLPQVPVSALPNILSGRLAGLYVEQQSTQPGGDNAAFLVRGLSTYGANGQSPLVLVDGAIRDFTDMDVNEIESVSVLKDAAALAWYGIRAANGIVYVTTRRGSASRTRVTFDTQGGVQMPINYTRPLNSYTYASLYNEALQNDGAAPLYNQAALDAYRSGNDRYAYPNNNFVDEFMRNQASVQRYVATASGGNAFARYFTLLSYFDQGGLLNQTETANYNSNLRYKRYNLRSNIDLHINKNLDVALDVGGRAENRISPRDGITNVLTTLYQTPPNAFPLLNRDGSYGGTSLFQSNPLGMLQKRGFTNQLTRVLLANLNVRQKLDDLLPGLSANIYYTFDVTQNFTSGQEENYEVYQAGAADAYTRFRTKAPLTYVNAAYGGYDRRTELWGGFDYKRTFGAHDLNATIRYQQAVRSQSGLMDNKVQGVSVRASYAFRDRYFAELVGSYSGTENFPRGKRFGWFPALSAGWIVSEEAFLKNVNVLDYLKLRASFGLTGNDGVGERRFAYNDLFSRGGTGYNFGTGYAAVPNASELSLANPNLTWEEARKGNIGVEAKLFRQALSLSVDLFHERRRNILTSAVTPSIIGQTLVQVNDGSAEYRGLETVLGFTKKVNQVIIGINGNLTVVNSKLLAINEAGIPMYQSQVGFPVGAYRLLQAEGLFQSDAEIANAPRQQFSGRVQPGDIRYRDTNGDGFVNDLDAVMTNQTRTPKSYYGLGVLANWKGLDLSLLFQGATGRTIDINSVINAGSANNGFINQFSVDRWTTASTALWPRLSINDRGNNTATSTYWLRSGDFLRLKQTELGYTLPSAVTQKLRLSSCRIYLSGFNLLTFSSINEALDPEIPGAGFINTYPYLKTFSLGLTVKL